MLKRFTCLFNLTSMAAAILLVLPLMVQQSAAQPALNVWSSNGPNAQIYSLVVDPNDRNTIYAGGPGDYGAGGRPTGVFKSINNGASWSASNAGLGNTHVGSLAIDPGNSNILYAGTGGGMFKSTNAGADWSSLNLSIDARFVRVSQSNPNTIFVADGSFTARPRIFVSTNGGATWTPRPLPDIGSSVGIAFLTIDPQDPNVIYTHAWNWDYDIALYKSTNGGVSWTNFNYSNSIFGTNSIEIDPNNSNNIYAATDYGVRKSTDGGVNWTLQGPSRYISALAIDPLNPQTLYAGTGTIGCCATGVYKSTDDGATWSVFNNGLTNLDVSQLAFDRTGRFLHAATPAGVFSVRIREDAVTVSLSGRVTTPDGRGLRNATVAITDPQGVQRTATTSSFGFYSFDNVAAGETYVISVSSRLYRFRSQILQINDTLTDVNFVGRE